MKPIENYETVQASSGEFARPTAGGYICKIIDVEDVAMNSKEQGKGDYLRIEYDIADGDFKNYYSEQFERWGGNWYASFIRSYKQKALGMFKHFTNSLENSNKGYQWDWNEKGAIGKYIGLVLGEEEYIANDGSVKTRMYVKDIKTTEQIKSGDFKIPELKKVERPSTPVPAFQSTDDSDDNCPF